MKKRVTKVKEQAVEEKVAEVAPVELPKITPLDLGVHHPVETLVGKINEIIARIK